MELVKFMTLAARVAPEQLPGVVVFYDGYNDANHGYYFGAGNVQNDLSAKLAVLVEHKSGRLSLYGASLGLAAVSAFWRTYVHRRLERALFHNPDPQPDKANLHRGSPSTCATRASRAASAPQLAPAAFSCCSR